MTFILRLTFVVLVCFVVAVDLKTNDTTSFCHVVKSKGHNLKYCNLTTKWEPRISKEGLTAVTSILSVISGVSTIYVLVKVAPMINKNYFQVASFPSCICCYPCYVVIPVLKLIWDGIDIMLDAYTFHQIETGKLIDSYIYRNTNVVNAILVFTVFGILKLFFNMFLIIKASKYFELNQKEDMLNIKRCTILTAFLLEDSIELFLEYFWIEKYFTYNPPFYLVARDIFIAIIVLCTITMDLLEVRNKETSKYQRILCAVMVLIGLTEFLRVASAIHQITTLKLNRACFEVSNGRLYQTPFNTKCLKNVEYGILVVGLIALLSCFYVFLVPFKVMTMKDKYKPKDEEQKSSKENLTVTTTPNSYDAIVS